MFCIFPEESLSLETELNQTAQALDLEKTVLSPEKEFKSQALVEVSFLAVTLPCQNWPVNKRGAGEEIKTW